MSWETVQFKDVATIVTGSTPKKVDENYGGNIPFVTPGDMGEHADISESKVSLTEEGAASVRLLPKNSVLVCCIGATIGKVGIATRTVTTNQQINSLIFDESKVIPKYAYYFCNTLAPFLRHSSSSTTMPIVNKSRFSEIKIPLPSLKEQKRIVAILDKADAISRKRQQAIDLTDQLLRSIFLDMFGDPVTNPKRFVVKPLAELCDVRDGTHDSPPYINNGYPLLTSKNLRSGRIDLSDVNYISENDYVEINKRSNVEVGDLLMPMIGTIGNPVRVDVEPDFAIKNVALIRVSESKINMTYLLYLLRSHYFEYITEKTNRGGTQKFVSLGDIRNLPVPLPDIGLVQSFDSIVEKLVLSRNRQEVSREQAETYFNAMSQQAFSGELNKQIKAA